jgi:hypothetical protein
MSAGRKGYAHHRLAPVPVARSRDGVWCWRLIGAAGVVTAVFVWWPR